MLRRRLHSALGLSSQLTSRYGLENSVGFVNGPEWRASSEVSGGETVSCAIAGPRRVTLMCESGSRLALSILPTEISREYGAGLPATCILIHTAACLPAKLRTSVRWD